MKNKGFSLVEAIVAFAIAAVAGLAVFGMMSASNNSFRRTSNDVGLQYEQQVVVNKLIDMLVESTNALGYDEVNKSVVVYNKIDKGPVAKDALVHNYAYEVSKIALEKEEDSDTGKLIYYSKEYADMSSVKAEDLAKTDDETIRKGTFGEEVKDIKFDITNIKENKISFTITFLSKGTEVTSTQVVSLRNNVDNADDESDIFAADGDFLNSFIKSITIYREDKYFTQGAVDEIKAIVGEPLLVQYFAKVTPINEKLSEREYGVKWSLKSNIVGMSVEEATGILSIDSTLLTEEDDILVNELVATSIDDPSKSQSVTIKVTGGGVYPESMSITIDQPIDSEGVKKFNIYPTIKYTDGTEDTRGTLCNWKVYYRDEDGNTKYLVDGEVSKDLAGCSFDSKTNEFIATSSASGKVINFIATTKAANSEGVRLTASKSLTVPEISVDPPKQQLQLGGRKDMYNNRGTVATVNPIWANALVSDFTYYWEIQPYGENWDENTYNRNFSKMISLSQWNSNVTTLTTTSNNRTLPIYCNYELDWDKKFSVLVTCYAVDSKGYKYGKGNTKDKNSKYEGPIEYVLTYEPVKFVLTVTDVYKQNNSKEFRFFTDRTLRRITNGEKDANGNYKNPASEDQNYYYNGHTVRYFRIDAQGLYYEGNTNNVTIELDKKGSKFFTNVVSKDKIQDGDIRNIVVIENADYLYGMGDYAGSNKKGIGLFFNMNHDNFANAFYGGVDKPAIFQPMIVAKTRYNLQECYITESPNYYDNSSMVKSSEYRYELKYDKNKLGDEDYVEIVEKWW